MAGIHAAEADVLTFLDSHIEATHGWLEPLLDRVARNYRTVACPVIEAIDEKTLQYKFVSQVSPRISSSQKLLLCRILLAPLTGSLNLTGVPSRRSKRKRRSIHGLRTSKKYL